MNSRAYEIYLASQVPPGGSEDEAKERVKQLFNQKSRPYYSDEDIKELERLEKEKEKEQVSNLEFDI